MTQVLSNVCHNDNRFGENFTTAQMSNLVVANVTFNNHDIHYKAGQTINGVLSIDRPQNVEISSLFISLRGDSNVAWQDATTTQSAHQTDLNIRDDYTKVFEKSQHYSVEKVMKLPFEFHLPEDLPSSIESQYGSTRYNCVVQIDSSCPSERPVAELFEFPFTVIARATAPEDDGKTTFRAPIRAENIIDLGSYTGPPDDIVVHLTVPKDCYTHGETIYAGMHVQNETYYHTIKQIGVALVQNIRCSIGSHVKTERKVIVAQKAGPILEHGRAEEIGVLLQVPNHCLPTQEGQIISIWYQVEIIGDENHLKAKTFIPIKIF